MGREKELWDLSLCGIGYVGTPDITPFINSIKAKNVLTWELHPMRYRWSSWGKDMYFHSVILTTFKFSS